MTFTTAFANTVGNQLTLKSWCATVNGKEADGTSTRFSACVSAEVLFLLRAR